MHLSMEMSYTNTIRRMVVQNPLSFQTSVFSFDPPPIANLSAFPKSLVFVCVQNRTNCMVDVTVWRRERDGLIDKEKCDTTQTRTRKSSEAKHYLSIGASLPYSYVWNTSRPAWPKEKACMSCHVSISVNPFFS